MPTTISKHQLTIYLTEAQLGYLAYRYPETDLKDALVLLLERERVRSLVQSRSSQQIREPSLSAWVKGKQYVILRCLIAPFIKPMESAIDEEILMKSLVCF